MMKWLHSKSRILEEQFTLGECGIWYKKVLYTAASRKAPGIWGCSGFGEAGREPSVARLRVCPCEQHRNPFPFLQEPCVRYLPRLYLDIHVRGVCLPAGGLGVGVGRDCAEGPGVPSSRVSGY